MFSRIAMPIDLAHTDRQDKALTVAADLAKHYDAQLVLVGVTGITPSGTAHNPEEYARKLADHATAAGQRHGLQVESHSVVSHDPGIDMEKQINRAIHEMGADLVVMASHVPSFRDYVFRSHTGTLATHTDVSVMIIR